jgi:hypothetical protein
MIKKWDKFNEGKIDEDFTNDLLNNIVNIPITLLDLVSGTEIIIVTISDKVFEKNKSNDWIEYESLEDFENKRGTLDNGYTESQQLMNIIDGIDDYRIDHIDSIYIKGEPTIFLKKILDSMGRFFPH